MRQIVVDTETTGLAIEQGHRIIEIGCIELINRRISGQQFHFYLNPQRDIEDGALEIHGITRTFLEDKPVFASIASELMTFLKGAELVIHNAPFDVGFLDYEFGLLGKRFQKMAEVCEITDTLVLARQLHPGQRNSLDALCKRYGVDNTRRELHGALLDAHLLSQVYLAMTGGQASLFDTPEFTEAETPVSLADVSCVSESAVLTKQAPLQIILASETELVLHQEKLAMMRQKGKCLWEN